MLVALEVVNPEPELGTCPELIGIRVVELWLIIVAVPITVPFPLPMIVLTPGSPLLDTKQELDSEIERGNGIFGTLVCKRVVGIEDEATAPLPFPDLAGSPTTDAVAEFVPLSTIENMMLFIAVVELPMPPAASVVAAVIGFMEEFMPETLPATVAAELTAEFNVELASPSLFVAAVTESAMESGEEPCPAIAVVARPVRVPVRAKPAPARALLLIETELTAEFIADVAPPMALSGPAVMPLPAVVVRRLSVVTVGPKTSPTSAQNPSRLDNAPNAAGTAVEANLAHDSTALSNMFGAQEVLE